MEKVIFSNFASKMSGFMFPAFITETKSLYNSLIFNMESKLIKVSEYLSY